MTRRAKPFALIAAMAMLGAILLLALVGRWAGSRPRVLPTAYDSVAVVFSPNGSLLATGHEVRVQNKAQGWGYMSGALELRQMPAGTLRNTVPFTERTARAQDSSKSIGAVGWMAFSPDGSLLLVSNYNNDSVAVLDVASGRWLFVRKGQWGAARRIYRPVGFSNEGKHVLYLLLVPEKMGDRSSEDRREKVVHKASLVTCEARTGKVVAQHAQVLRSGEWPMRLVLLPDGQSVACTTRIGNDSGGYTDRGKVLLIDAGTGRRKQVAALDYLPIELACAPDGRTLVLLDAEGTAHFCDVNLSEHARSAGRSDGALRARDFSGGHWLAFSPDGRWLAGVSRDTIALWDTQHKGRAARFIEQRGKWAWVNDLAFSADGRTLAVADGERSVALWPVAPAAK